MNSYHKGYAWSDNVMQGIEETLSSQPENIEVWIEYMDTKRFPDERHRNHLFEQYRNKYANRRFDAIITADDNALNFLLQRRAAIFNDTPVVFAGINNFDPSMLHGHSAITGVVEHPDFAETINIAHRLHPTAKSIVVALPETTTGKAIKMRLRGTHNTKENEINIELWEGLAFETLLEKLATRSDAPIVLTLGTGRTRNGRVISNTEKAERIAEASNGPVYGSGEFLLGHGIIGGKLTSGFTQGETAAQYAIDIIRGTRPEDIPVLTESPNRIVFDFNVLQRFGISVSDLPAQSVVINQPQTTYERYRDFALVALLAVIVLCGISAALVVNIIQRKKAQDAFRESETRLQGFIENSPAAIYIKDLDGRYVLANEEFRRRFDLTPEMVIGKRTREICPPKYSDAAEKQDAEVLETRSVCKREAQTRHADGIIHTHVVIKFPLVDLKGEMRGIGCVSTDITDMKMAHEAARELQSELAHVSRLSTMGEMATGLAHELNQPLAAISNYAMGCIHRLDRGNLNAENIRPAITQISEQALRAGEIIRRIRGFVGKKDTGRADTELPEIDINAAIRSAAGLLGNEALDHKANIRLMLAPVLPPVSADAIQIQQIIVNLARNAMEAMSDASCEKRDLTIRTLRAENGSAEFRILDTGPGISEEAMSELFHPFFTTKSSGLGMGLSICQSIINAHGGEMTARNRNRGGAEFRVTLATSKSA